MEQRMVRTAKVAAISAMIVFSLPMAASAAGVGLWPSNFTAPSRSWDCWMGPDLNNFCYSYEAPLEVGVRFTTSERLLISGVRAYRVDNASQISGTLWKADGTLLATGTFADVSPVHRWQDMEFAVPVLVEPYTTYIASYYAKQGRFPYEWYFFSSSSLTVGPITALQSVEGNGNGVYCYAAASCFPTDTNFRNTNYWVSPLWVYAFDGFYQPVDNGDAWNKAKAGSAIPVKFSLDGDHGLSILKIGYPKATPVACPSAGTPTDPIEETVAAGSSGLTYDPYADQYVYAWKTNKLWAGKCYKFDLGLKDDTPRTFLVQFFK